MSRKLKLYAVLFRYDGLDTEETFAEWFTTKKGAIARAKEINRDPDEVIRDVYVYKAQIPTNKKALLQWLNDCYGVQSVPGTDQIWSGYE